MAEKVAAAMEAEMVAGDVAPYQAHMEGEMAKVVQMVAVLARALHVPRMCQPRIAGV